MLKLESPWAAPSGPPPSIQQQQSTTTRLAPINSSTTRPIAGGFYHQAQTHPPLPPLNLSDRYSEGSSSDTARAESVGGGVGTEAKIEAVETDEGDPAFAYTIDTHQQQGGDRRDGRGGGGDAYESTSHVGHGGYESSRGGRYTTHHPQNQPYGGGGGGSSTYAHPSTFSSARFEGAGYEYKTASSIPRSGGGQGPTHRDYHDHPAASRHHEHYYDQDDGHAHGPTVDSRSPGGGGGGGEVRKYASPGTSADTAPNVW